MAYQSIDEVISALETITNTCKKTQLRAGYFSALYLRMTKAVKADIEKGLFKDGNRMEQLDICFAQRYIAAFNDFYGSRSCSKSWHYAFDCCKSTDNIVLQHLLLGINTHINLDLAIAAAMTAPGTAIFDLETDFNQINDTITSLTDDIQECLSRVWLPMRLLARISNRRQDAVLNFSISKARQSSWANALLLSGMDEAARNTHIQAMDNLVLKIAQGIQNPGRPISWLLHFIKNTECENISEIIRLIEEVTVD